MLRSKATTSSVPKAGTLQIGATVISLGNKLEPTTYKLANGETCQVSWVDGVLSVSTTSARDIIISDLPSLVGLKLESAGRVSFRSNVVLRPTQAFNIKAKQITLDAVIIGTDELNLQASRAVTVNGSVAYKKVKIKAAKTIVTNQIHCMRCSIKSNEFVQTATSLVNVGTWGEQVSTKRSRIIARNAVIKGSFTGEKLDINVLERLKVKGQIVVDGLKIKAKKLRVTLNAMIDGVSDLFVHGKFLFVTGKVQALRTRVKANHILVMFYGILHGSENLRVESVSCTTALGGRLWGMTSAVSAGWYLNFLGWGASYNNIHDNFIGLDLGLNTPYIPRSWAELKEVVNRQKVLFAARAVLKYLFAPLGMALRIVLKVMSVKRNFAKAKKLINELRSKPIAEQEDFAIDAVSAALAVKNIFFAADAFAEIPNIVNYDYASVEVPNTPEKLARSVQNNAKPVLFRAMSAVAPCYVADSAVTILAGATVTGGENLTNYRVKHHKYTYTLNSSN